MLVSNTNEIEALVATARHWRVNGQVWTVKLESGDSVEVTSDQLAAYHPLLPALLHDLARHSRYAKTSFLFPGANIRETLAMWKTSLLIPEVTGRTAAVSTINALQSYSDGQAYVMLDVTERIWKPVEKLRRGADSPRLPKGTPCVMDLKEVLLIVPEPWVTATYPNWKTRYVVTQGLSYSGAEQAALVFGADQAVLPTSSLTEVSFD